MFSLHSRKGRRSDFFLPELFWMDLIMENPLDAEINVSNVTLVVNENLASAGDFLEVEVIKDVTLGPHASTSVRVPPI
jgi:hypothetical protein